MSDDTNVKYDEFVKRFSNPRVGLAEYSYNSNFAVAQGSEAIISLDDSFKGKALNVFKAIGNVYASGEKFTTQGNYDVLTTAFLLKQYGDVVGKLSVDNIVLIADYFSLCEEEYIGEFVPFISNNEILSSIRNNCNGLINQGIMCSKVIQHAIKDGISLTVDDNDAAAFFQREIQYVEANPMQNSISDDDIKKLNDYVHNHYFINGQESRK